MPETLGVCGHRAVLVKTVDSDLPVIGAGLFHQLAHLDKLFIEYGTSKYLKVIPVHDVVSTLGPKAKAYRCFMLFPVVTQSHLLSMWARLWHGMLGTSFQISQRHWLQFSQIHPSLQLTLYTWRDWRGTMSFSTAGPVANLRSTKQGWPCSNLANGYLIDFPPLRKHCSSTSDGPCYKLGSSGFKLWFFNLPSLRLLNGVGSETPGSILDYLRWCKQILWYTSQLYM